MTDPIHPNPAINPDEIPAPPAEVVEENYQRPRPQQPQQQTTDAVPQEKSAFTKGVAFVLACLGGLYLINPTAGVFELIPDVIPVVGNLDEGAAMFILLAALKYLGVHIPFLEDFFGKSDKPQPQPPAKVE